MNKEGTLKRFPEKGELTAEETKKRFDRIDFILFGVVLAVLIGMIALLFSVVAMFWDQMRLNNAAYHDYASKLEIQNQYLQTVSEIGDKQADILKKIDDLDQEKVKN